MRSRIATSLTLIGWQAIAAVLAVTGHADTFLATWSEPTWIAVALAVLLTPSRWVVAAALVLAIGLMIWGLYDRRRHRRAI